MYDVIIIGCGASGAACAYSLSKYHLNVAVLEASNDVANGTTKANSAIIHAGYDPEPGTLMARLNVSGSEMTPELCRKLDVPYRQCGSLVLAFSDDDMAHLEVLHSRGEKNGVRNMRILTKEEALEMEPQLSPAIHGALYAPTAGIVNPWEYALALAETAVRNGVELHLLTSVEGIRKEGEIYRLKTNRGDFEARCVVNAAGVHTGDVHAMLEEPAYRTIPTRGQYYLLDKSEGDRVSKVIFRCPGEKGKGVLVAPTVHGNLIVGPDAVVGEADDTSTDREGIAAVGESAKRSVPSIDFKQSIRNFAGIRANTDIRDFIIEESKACPKFIDVAGIRSPGLSAAPAIGEYVTELIGKSGISLDKKVEFTDSRTRIRFHELNAEEKNALISQDPAYGRIICRCESITEGEIVAALHAPIPPVSINGVKRRCGAGMGRCQGGFCAPKVHELISRELGIDWLDVCLEEPGSKMLAEETKL